ncbi:hypothetical protein BH10PSE2_BH10PSE2_07600 [soil metagenome]
MLSNETVSSRISALARAGNGRKKAHESLVQDDLLRRAAALEACTTNPLLNTDLWVDIGFERPMKIDAREVVSQQIYLYRTFEPELVAYFSRVLRPGDIFLDVGAHFGYFSIVAAHLVGKTGQVVAFEPIPETFTTLWENTAHLPQVNREPLAAWSDEGFLELFYYGRALSAFSSFSAPRLDADLAPQSSSLHVKKIRLDDYCKAERIIPTHIKIDAENAERFVIEGLSALIETHHPTITVEVGDSGSRTEKGESSREMLELLLAHGYALFEPGLSKTVPHVLRGIGEYEYCNIVAEYNSH